MNAADNLHLFECMTLSISKKCSENITFDQYKVIFSVMSVYLSKGVPCTGPQPHPLSREPWPSHPPPSPLYKAPAHPSLPGMFRLVHYKARTVGKRVLDIRVKCLLILLIFTLTNKRFSNYIVLLLLLATRHVVTD